MNHNTLFIISLIFIFAIRRTLSADYHYEVCKVPKYCGHQLIKYPFYIENEQEAFCGYPRFQVSCKNNKTMIKLNDMDGEDYIIKEIFYRNQTLRVSNAALDISDRNYCLPSIHNLTVDTIRNEFNRTSNHGDVYILYDCSLPGIGRLPGYKFECPGGNESLVTLGMDSRDPKFDDVSKNCTRTVRLPADVGYEVEDIIREGFLLNWTATSCNLCEKSGGHCGFNTSSEIYNFQCYCRDRPHYKSCVQEDGHALEIGLGTGIPAILMTGLLVYFLYRRRKRKYGSPDTFSASTSYPSNADLEEGGAYCGVPVFSYKELEEATKNFDSSKELGDGGFGTVYFGKLKDGREVAVKRLYEHNYRRVEQFINEIEILTRLRHKNLVSLYGCTSRQSRELLLVYEYIPNGTVADHLHGDRAKPGSLNWSTRMSIAIETAKALAYLHASDIIHRDVKTNNILLDNNFCVKVADFGLSRLFPNDVTHVSTAPQGTPGYVDPEYHQCYQLTDKSDVYSFGVVLVELISSMPAVDITRHRHEINLSNLAIAKIQKKAYSELVDPTLGFESDSSIKKMVKLVSELAFRCLQQDKEMRPSMDEVLEALEDIASGELELVSLEKAHTENAESESVLPPASPECDEVGLLKISRQPSSPISVAEKWISRSTTPNSSA